MIRLIIICLGLLPIQLMGQFVYFNNTHIHEDANAQIFSDVIVRSEDYLIMSMKLNDSIIFRSNSILGFDGELLENESYHNQGWILGNYADTFMPTSEGSVFAGGADNGSYRYIASYDDDLQLDLSVTYPHQDSSALEEFHGLGLVNDDDFTAFGVRFYDSDDDPWMESCRIEVSKIDMDGNIIQQNLIDPDYSDYYRVNQIFELPNGYHFLNGTAYSQGDNMLLLLDENYELVDSHFWGHEEINDWVMWSIQEADPWYFTGLYQEALFLDEFNTQVSEVHLRRYKAPNMDILWDITFPYEFYRLGVAKVLRTADGGYVNLFQAAYPTNNGIQSFLLKTDSLGNEEWFKTYTHFDNPESLNKLYDIEIAPDGGFIAVGETQTNDPFNQTPQSGWILKLDACGDVEWEGCEYVGVDPMESLQLSVYPNPATNQLNLDWNSREPAQVVLRDLHGRIVKTFTHVPPSSTFDIQDVSPGMYLMEVTDGVRVLGKRVLVSND